MFFCEKYIFEKKKSQRGWSRAVQPIDGDEEDGVGRGATLR